MESLLSQIKLLSTTADKAARRELMVALRDLAYSIEEPDDTIHRIGYLVRVLLPCKIKQWSHENLTRKMGWCSISKLQPSGWASIWGSSDISR